MDAPTFLSIMHHTNAPEPSSLFLFGSGFMGIMVSFVQSTYKATKRFIDVAGSILALIILSPICLLTALLIKCVSKGPVIFTQTRLGFNGQLFEIYKFRT